MKRLNKVIARHPVFWVFAVITVVLFIVGQPFVGGLLAFLTVVFTAVAASVRAKDRKLAAAPRGSTRIEAVKAQHVNNTVDQYTKAGWAVTGQSTAKSLGSQAQVTITFTKV